MRRFAVDTWHVAAYELGEATRTRLLQLILLAYLGAIGSGNYVFIRILQELEASVAEQMMVPATERPGAMLAQVLASGEVLKVLGPFVGTNEAAKALFSEPLLALWAGGLAMVFLPLLMLFSAAASVASEVRSRSIRYLLCRTGRLEIGLGKLAGQVLLACVAAGLGIALSMGMGMTLMVQQPPVAMLAALTRHTLLACAYSLPFAGLGLAISGLIPSPNGARAVAAAAYIAMHIGAAILDDYAGPTTMGRIADIARLFFASTAWQDLWSLDGSVLTGAVGRCVILAVAYYAIGHLRFGTRDL